MREAERLKTMNAREKIRRVGDDLGFVRAYIEWYIAESAFDERHAALRSELTADERQDISFDLVRHAPEFVRTLLIN